ncbi:hypothetical protein CHARACLAT_031940 [Characodon lateralis]|uniref:Uncharacterized protein n=1 Tax=Characodon lateralis TaxID=208331 RepID=A0ABU7EEL6_9TELE|nr:hypothetical protein [Characodon lateralis]
MTCITTAYKNTDHLCKKGYCETRGELQEGAGLQNDPRIAVSWDTSKVLGTVRDRQSVLMLTDSEEKTKTRRMKT